ncbi:hypothetical protein ACO0RG_000032 [Hanseniaspora osmophila]
MVDGYTHPVEFLNDNTFSSHDIITESLNYLGDEYDAEHAKDPNVPYDRDFGGPHDFLRTSEFECKPIPTTNQEILLGEPLKIFSLNVFAGKSTMTMDTDKVNDDGLSNYDVSQKPFLDSATIKENFDENSHVRQPVSEIAHDDSQAEMDVDKFEEQPFLSNSNSMPETLESLNESDVEYLLQRKSKTGETLFTNAEAEKSSQKTSKHLKCTVVVTKHYLYVYEKREYKKFGKELVDCCKISSYDESMQQSDILVATFFDGSAALIGLLQNEDFFWNVEILTTVQLSRDEIAKNGPFGYGLRLWNVVSHPHDPRICVFYCMQSSQIKFYNIHSKKFALVGKGNMWCKGHEFHSIKFFPSTYNSTNGENNENGKFDGVGFSKVLDRNNNSNIFEGTPTTYVLHVVTTFEKSNYSLFVFYYNEWSREDWCVSTKHLVQHRLVEFYKSREAVVPAKNHCSVPLLKQEIVTLNLEKNGFCYYNLLELSSANSDNVNCFAKNVIALNADDDNNENELAENIKLSFILPCSLSVLKYWKNLYAKELETTESCFIVALSTDHLLMAFVQSNKKLLFGLITKVKGVNNIELCLPEFDETEQMTCGAQSRYLKILVSSKFGLVHSGEVNELIHLEQNKNQGELNALSNCFFSNWQDMLFVYCKNYDNIFDLKQIFVTVPQCEKLLSIPSVAGSTNPSGCELWSIDNKYGATQFLFQRNALTFFPVFETNKFLTALKFFCLPLNEFHDAIVQAHFAPYFDKFTKHTKETNIDKYALFVFALAGSKTTFQLWDLENQEFHCIDHHFENTESLLKGSTSACNVVGKRFLIRAIETTFDDAFASLPLEVYCFGNDGTLSPVHLLGFDMFSPEDAKNMVVEFTAQSYNHVAVLLSVNGVQLCFYTCYRGTGNSHFESADFKTWTFKSVNIENTSFKKINSMQFISDRLLLGSDETTWEYILDDSTDNIKSSKQIDISCLWEQGLIRFNSHLVLNDTGFDFRDMAQSTDWSSLTKLPKVSIEIKNAYTPVERNNHHMQSNGFQTVSYNSHTIHYLDLQSYELLDVDLNMPWNSKHHLIMCCDAIGTNHIAVLFDDKFCILGKNLHSEIKFIPKGNDFINSGDFFASFDGPPFSKDVKGDIWNLTTESVKNVNRILLKKMIGNGVPIFGLSHGATNNYKCDGDTLNKSIFEYCDKVNRVIFFDFKSYLGDSPAVYGMKPHCNVMNKLCKIDDNGIFASLKNFRKDKKLKQRDNNKFDRKLFSKSFRVPSILKVYPSTNSERFNVLVTYNALGSQNNVLKIIKLVPSSKKICLQQVFEYKFCDNDPFGQDVTWIETPLTRTASNTDYYLVWLYNEHENAIKALKFQWNDLNTKITKTSSSLQMVSNCSWVLPPVQKLKQMCSLPGDRLLLLFADNTLGVLVHKLQLKQDVEDLNENFFKNYMHSTHYSTEKEKQKHIHTLGFIDPITERNFNFEYNDIEIANTDFIPFRLKRQQDDFNKLNFEKLSENDSTNVEPLFYPLSKENYKIMELYSQERGVFNISNIDYIVPLPEYSYMKNQNMFLAFDVLALDQSECVINISMMCFKSTDKKTKADYFDEFFEFKKNNHFYTSQVLASKKCTNPVLSSSFNNIFQHQTDFKPILDVKLVPLKENSLNLNNDSTNSIIQHEYYFVHVLLANGQLETLELKEVYPFKDDKPTSTTF